MVAFGKIIEFPIFATVFTVLCIVVYTWLGLPCPLCALWQNNNAVDRWVWTVDINCKFNCVMLILNSQILLEIGLWIVKFENGLLFTRCIRYVRVDQIIQIISPMSYSGGVLGRMKVCKRIWPEKLRNPCIRPRPNSSWNYNVKIMKIL